MTAHLVGTLSSGNVACFFFCRFDDEISLKAKTVIGSTIRQLVSNLPATAFQELSYKTTDWSTIIGFLEGALSHTHQYFIVLDGLDECEEAQIHEVARFLHRLLTSSVLCIKIFWSSRPNVQRWVPERFLVQRHIDSESTENQSKVACDIHKFIRVTLEEWLDGETPELQINDPDLIRIIPDHLETKAQGMYAFLIPIKNVRLTLIVSYGLSFSSEHYVRKIQIIRYLLPWIICREIFQKHLKEFSRKILKSTTKILGAGYFAGSLLRNVRLRSKSFEKQLVLRRYRRRGMPDLSLTI